MMINAETAKEDLAFMRAVMSEDGTHDRKFGFIYMMAGLLYGVQCVLIYTLMTGFLPASELIWLAAGWLPTVLFLIFIFYFTWAERAVPFGTSAAKRAINAAFAGGGLANLILALAFGFIAYQRQDYSLWLLFPIVVCAIQGSIWFTVSIIRRQSWYGFTAAGWFISIFALCVVFEDAATYNLVLGVALFLCMALPGYLIMRAAVKPAP